MRHDRSSISVPRPALLALLLSAAFLTGCGTSTKPVAPVTPPLSHVTVTPNLDTLAVGGQIQFVGAAFDTGGTEVSVALSWSSNDTRVCTISNTGLATAVGEGTAIVTGAAGGKSATAAIYVHGTASGWATQASGTTQNLRAVWFLPDGHTGYAVGDAGTLVGTPDAGVTWTSRTSGTTSRLNAICFASASQGWAVGTAGTIMHSTNGGTSWTKLTGTGIGSDLFCVRFANTQYGWVVGAGGFLGRTRNGGTSWDTQFVGGKDLFSVAFSDTSNGWAVGDGIILGTVDGGANWTQVLPAITAQPLRSVARVSTDAAWAVGGLGSTPSTSPSLGGPVWSLTSQGAAYDLQALHMVNGLSGWAVGSNGSGAILRTSNGGTTWTPQTSNSAQALYGVYFADGLRGWAVGAAGRIVHTSDGGGS